MAWKSPVKVWVWVRVQFGPVWVWVQFRFGLVLGRMDLVWIEFNIKITFNWNCLWFDMKYMKKKTTFGFRFGYGSGSVWVLDEWTWSELDPVPKMFGHFLHFVGGRFFRYHKEFQSIFINRVKSIDQRFKLNLINKSMLIEFLEQRFLSNLF